MDGTGLNNRLGIRKSGGDEGGEGSILGLNNPVAIFCGRRDKGEDREGVCGRVGENLQGVVGLNIWQANSPVMMLRCSIARGIV